MTGPEVVAQDSVAWGPTAISKGRERFLSLAYLVPDSGIVFVDFQIAVDKALGVVSRFVEDSGASGVPILVPVRDSTYDEPLLHPVTSESLRPDEALLVSGAGSLQHCFDQWLPLPFMRYVGRSEAGQLRYDSGPTNWVRLWISAPAGDLNDTDKLTAVLAIDTRLVEPPAAANPDDDYAAPSRHDSRFGSVFSLVSDPAELAPFLGEAWVQTVLRGRGLDVDIATAHPESSTPAFALAHVARYLVLLKVLAAAAELPSFRFIDTFGSMARSHAVPVDLVLDIGDDEITALLVDGGRPPGSADPVRFQPLQLRELSRPHVVHAEPFKSIVEFSRAEFGDASASRRSGRLDAFAWPSLVRTGPEASRLALRAGAAQGVTGLSDLKSAAADERAHSGVWRFSRDDALSVEAGPIVSGELLRHITEDGHLIAASTASQQPAIRPRFSAAAVFSLLVAELVLHAGAQLNEPLPMSAGGRLRTLRKVVVTCSAACTADERELMRKHIVRGIDIVWTAYGWSGAGESGGMPRPEAALGLDPSLSAQLVYLLDELRDRFDGDARLFSELSRRNRPGRDDVLHIASLDMAMAETNVAVVGYEFGDRQLQLSRIILAERGAVAGAAIRDAVIGGIVRASIEAALEAAGLAEPRRFMESLLGGTPGSPEARFAVRFRHKIERPAAHALLDAARAALATSSPRSARPFTLQALVEAGGGRLAPLDAHFTAQVAAQGVPNFALGEVAVVLRPLALRRLIEAEIAPLVERITEIVRCHDVDLLLLSGPLAGLGEVARLVLRKLPLAPHRIIDVGARQLEVIGRLAAGRIEGDPRRIAAAVGAAIAGSSAGSIADLAVLASEADPRSLRVDGPVTLRPADVAAEPSIAILPRSLPS